MIHGSADQFNSVDKMKTYLSPLPGVTHVDIHSASMDKQKHRVIRHEPNGFTTRPPFQALPTGRHGCSGSDIS